MRRKNGNTTDFVIERTKVELQKQGIYLENKAISFIVNEMWRSAVVTLNGKESVTVPVLGTFVYRDDIDLMKETGAYRRKNGVQNIVVTHLNHLPIGEKLKEANINPNEVLPTTEMYEKFKEIVGFTKKFKKGYNENKVNVVKIIPKVSVHSLMGKSDKEV